MFGTKFPSQGSTDPLPFHPADYHQSTRTMFALRERLEEEGLGNSRQAKKLDLAFLSHRKFILEEIGPLFHQLDKSRIARTRDPRFWWWKLDDEKVVEEMSCRLGVA